MHYVICNTYFICHMYFMYKYFILSHYVHISSHISHLHVVPAILARNGASLMCSTPPTLPARRLAARKTSAAHMFQISLGQSILQMHVTYDMLRHFEPLSYYICTLHMTCDICGETNVCGICCISPLSSVMLHAYCT